MLTLPEIAAALNIAEVTARRYTERKHSPIRWRYATPEETGALIAAGRVTYIPPAGLRVVDNEEFERFKAARRTSAGSGRKPIKGA